MRPLRHLLALLLLLPGCAHLGMGSAEPRERVALWSEGHKALADGDFVAAERSFERLALRHPNTVEGHESLFYLGTIHLDPRNPTWDPGPAQGHLAAYLGLSEAPGEGARASRRLYRHPEARTLYELAHQLNLPAEHRVAGLQPEEWVVRIEERVVVPAEQTRELAEEVQRLRQQVAERDARLRRQEEELERIRRTLTPR